MSTTTTVNALDTILAQNAAVVRKQQLVQQVRMVQAGPAQIAQAQVRQVQTIASLKTRILLPEAIADLGSDYATVKDAVDAL
jgi:hypothetical protein